MKTIFYIENADVAMSEPNSYFQGEGWYWSDESYCLYGPYSSYKLAEKAQNEYVETFLKGK